MTSEQSEGETDRTISINAARIVRAYFRLKNGVAIAGIALIALFAVGLLIFGPFIVVPVAVGVNNAVAPEPWPFDYFATLVGACVLWYGIIAYIILDPIAESYRDEHLDGDSV